MLLEDLPKNSVLSDRCQQNPGSSFKAQSITNQMLTFSRHVEQEKIQVSVSDVLKETIGFVKSAVPADIVIKSRMSEKGCKCLC